MNFNHFIKYAVSAKKFTQDSVRSVSQMPLEKMAISTAAVVLPGGIVISGVYVAAQELRQRYVVYAATSKKENETPDSFKTWLNANYADYLKEKKEIAVSSVSVSMKSVRAKVTQLTSDKIDYFTKSKK